VFETVTARKVSRRITFGALAGETYGPGILTRRSPGRWEGVMNSTEIAEPAFPR
jgi:hypothetical protein